MKKYQIKSFMLFAALLSLGLYMTSCSSSSSDPDPIPVADFTTAIDGKTVTFTNTSKDGVTYLWDFNDGSTSTDKSPSHTYEANGTFLIKLTATNPTGSDDKETVLEIINITIDGDLSDWDDVPAVAGTGSGSLTKVKIDNLGKDKLFFYVEGNGDMTSFFDLYLDFDHDATGGSDTTGYRASGYPGAKLVGCDVLFEGFFGSTTGRNDLSGMFYGVFFADALVDFSKRDEPVLDPNMIKFTDLKVVGSGFALEFSVDLGFLPDRVKVSDEIQIFIDEWNHDDKDNSAWWGGFSGNFPAQGAEGALPIRYTFK